MLFWLVRVSIMLRMRKKGYKPHTTESFQITEDAKSSVIKEKVSLEKEK
jgi:hypothetical protein